MNRGGRIHSRSLERSKQRSNKTLTENSSKENLANPDLVSISQDKIDSIIAACSIPQKVDEANALPLKKSANNGSKDRLPIATISSSKLGKVPISLQRSVRKFIQRSDSVTKI
jgi:hypothetical protein